MSQEEEDKIVESETSVISQRAKELVQNIKNSKNWLPVEAGKALTLITPK